MQIYIALKARRVVIGASVLLAVLLLGLYVQTQLVQQSREHLYEEEVRNILDKVQVEVSQMRGLTAPQDIRLEIVSIDFFRSAAGEGMQEDLLLKAQESLFRGILLVPENFSLLSERVSEAGRTLAATSGRTLYVVKEYFDPSDKRLALRTLAHEYTHILQSVYIHQPDIDTADALLAWTSFIEGEADLVADLYTAQATGEQLLLNIPPPPTTMPENASSGWGLDQVFIFPYTHGENFVYQLYLKEEWAEVNKAYQNPPTSSAEILYPDLYLAGFEPSNLSNKKPATEGWSLYHPDRLGEYYMRVLLLEELPPTIAVNASLGWVGDNATVYLNHNTYLFFWKIMWRDEVTASTFEKALLSFFAKKGGVEGNSSYWSFDGRLIALERVSNWIILIGSSDLQVLMKEKSEIQEFGS